MPPAAVSAARGRRVLDRLNDSPALVLTDMADTLAMNPLATALLGDQTLHTGLARSAYYR